MLKRLFRGKGIARALMNKVLDSLSKNRDIRAVRIEVNEEQIPANKLYASFGFEKVGEGGHVMGDGLEHNEILMEKAINSGKGS